MHKLRFKQCQAEAAEHTVFYRYMGKDVVIVAVDVDNLTMAET